MPIQTGFRALASDFINRLQRNDDPTVDAGRVAKLENNGRIHPDFLPLGEALPVGETMDGTTTPVPVTMVNDALYKTQVGERFRTGFAGFVKEAFTVAQPSLTGSILETSSSTQSFTTGTGNDLVLVVLAFAAGTSPVSTPTMDWDGNAMTEVGVTNSLDGLNRTKITAFVYPLGDVDTPIAANVVRSGGGGSSYSRMLIFTMQDAAQADITAGFFGESSASITSFAEARNITAPTQTALIMGAYRAATSVNVTTAGVTDLDTGTNHELAQLDATDDFTASCTASSSNGALAVFFLNGTKSNKTNIQNVGMVDGFTGLQVNQGYYTTDTEGGFDPSGEGIKIGYAVSATQMLLNIGQRRANGVVNGGSGRIELGFRPSVIRMTGGSDSNGGNQTSVGTWVNGQYACCYSDNSTADWTTSTSFILRDAFDAEVTVTVDKTGFNYSGGSGNTNFYWEVEE